MELPPLCADEVPVTTVQRLWLKARLMLRAAIE